MQVSQQADIFVVVPNPKYNNSRDAKAVAQSAGPNPAKSQNPAILVPLGFAQSISVDDNFNAQAVNVLGQPLPIIHPGFQLTTISIEKATIDGYSFRNLGGFNPLWAHIGASYLDSSQVDVSGLASLIGTQGTSLYPFMFILALKDRVSNSFNYSNVGQLGSEGNMEKKAADYANLSSYTPDPGYTVTAADDASPGLIGSYVCVVNTVRSTIQANQAVIMDNVSVYARPLNGTWMNDIMRAALDSEGTGGMDDSLYDPRFGYNSRKLV